jgi:hypothetical protein
MGYIFGLLDSILTSIIGWFFLIIVLVLIDTIVSHARRPIR